MQLTFTNYWNLSSKTIGNSVNEIWVIIAILPKRNLGLTGFTGGYSLVFMDEFVYSLLTEERVCDIIMPRLAKRQVLEENGDIGPRKSRLLAAMEGESDEGNKSNGSRDSSISRSTQSRRTSHSRTPSDAGSRYVSRSPSRSISRSPSPSHGTSDYPMDVDTEYHNN